MIKELFKEYIIQTQNIKSGVSINVSVEEFLVKRQEIINKIVELEISPQEKKEEYIKSGAQELDTVVMKLIYNNMQQTKESIKNTGTGRKAFNSYVQGNQAGSFFRKTI